MKTIIVGSGNTGLSTARNMAKELALPEPDRLRYKSLKQGQFLTGVNSTRPALDNRYILENFEDVENFFKKFPDAKFFMLKPIVKDIENGVMVICTDARGHGYPSWCTASDKEPNDNSHPGSYFKL